MTSMQSTLVEPCHLCMFCWTSHYKYLLVV